MDIIDYDKFELKDFYHESDGNFMKGKLIENSTLIIQFEDTGCTDLTVTYSKFFKYDKVIIKEFEDIFSSLNFDRYDSIIIISKHDFLDYQKLMILTRWSCSNNKIYGLIVGNKKEIAYQMYKTIVYSKSDDFFSNRLVLTPKHINLEDNGLLITSIYNPSIDKTFFQQKKIFTGLFGGGRIDQLSIGSKLKLMPLDLGDSTIVANALNTQFLMVNGCVLGNTSPKKFERQRRHILSREILNSKIIGYIAPFAVKLSDEFELELAQAMFESGMCLGSVSFYSNLYCKHHELDPLYVYYGDPNLKEERLRKNYNIINIKTEKDILVSDSAYSYFKIDEERTMIISKKNENYQIEQYKLNMSQVLYHLNSFKRNMQKNLEINKMVPSSNEFKKKLNINNELYKNLRKEMSYFGTDTSKNNEIIKKINNILDDNKKITNTIIDYWKSNVIKDKFRIYDLHFGLNSISENRKGGICPVCGDYCTKEINSCNYLNETIRYVTICPSCSVIDDRADEFLNVEVQNSELIGNMVLLDIKVYNSSNSEISTPIGLCLRGIEIAESKTKYYRINSKSYKKIKIEAKISCMEEINDMIYATILCCVDGGISLFKRQFYV